MNINEIYEEFSVGSEGFINAVMDNDTFDISREEIEELASISPTPEEFVKNWENF